MRLLRARFSNFRLLRDLELDLRLDGDKRLIVLRAENESGKTTILNGLQWGLFGDDAIPRDRGTYRLHPIDWDRSQGDRVPITVEIDFEVTNTHRTRSGDLQTSSTEYRLIRSTSDTLNDETWSPGPTTSSLFEATPQGDRPIQPPECHDFRRAAHLNSERCSSPMVIERSVSSRLMFRLPPNRPRSGTRSETCWDWM